jgi:hypothetical protein
MSFYKKNRQLNKDKNKKIQSSKSSVNHIKIIDEFIATVKPSGPTGPKGGTGPTGPTGQTGATGTSGPIAGTLYYFNRSLTTDIDDYTDLDRIPSNNPENFSSDDISVSTGNLEIASFITPIGDPGLLYISDGIWTISLWAAVSSLPANLIVRCYIYSENGDMTILDAESCVINSQMPTQYTIPLNISAISTNQTDRIVVKILANTPLLDPITISIFYEGTDFVSTLFTQLTQGLSGINGQTGPTGANGFDGEIGPTGPFGDGSTGPIGPTGDIGPIGPTGDIGATGPNGNDGATGPPGDIGATGPNGNDGATGPTGQNGTHGATGYTGSIGAAGATGPTGPTGSVGLQGVTGAQGIAGSTGTRGSTGATGSNGANGTNGGTGPTGPAGQVLAFAEYYAIMPSDNPSTIAAGTAINFPQNGDSYGSIFRSGSSTFTLLNVGSYQIWFCVGITEPAQLVIGLDSSGSGSGPVTEVAKSIVGRSQGSTQIIGQTIITTVVPSSQIMIRNISTASSAITVTTSAGGTSAVSAHLIITQLK